MRANIWMFWILTVFFFAAAALYTVWIYIDYQNLPETTAVGRGPVEWIGTVTLTLSGALAAFIAFYLSLTKRSIGGTLPEDRLDAEIDDGDPETGHFSPWSWWPIVLAAGLALVFLGSPSASGSR